MLRAPVDAHRTPAGPLAERPLPDLWRLLRMRMSLADSEQGCETRDSAPRESVLVRGVPFQGED